MTLRPPSSVSPANTQVLKRTWGANWQRHFERFSFTPIAAASIGQVHESCVEHETVVLGDSPDELVARLDLPDDPDDARWAHLLIEATTAAAFDRPDVLSDVADGAVLTPGEVL